MGSAGFSVWINLLIKRNACIFNPQFPVYWGEFLKLDSVRKFLIATNEFRLSILIVLLFFKLNLMIDCSISVLLYVVGDTQGFD